MRGENENRVMIVGGSFAGLAAAVALGRVGIQAVVFERSSTLQTIGAGLVLQIAAMKALRKMGLLDSVRAITGDPIQAIQIKSATGRVLATIPQSRLGRELDTPGFVVHGPDFLNVLARRAAIEATVKLGAQCAGFDQDGAGVTAHFADGKKERGAVLLGADGIHSVVREQALGSDPLVYSGYTAWRAMPIFSHPAIPSGILQQGSGRGVTFGIYPAGGRVYWFAGKKAPAGGDDGPGGPKRRLLDLYRGWFRPVEDLIESTDESAILRHDVYDRDPVECWGRGCVTLAGDAAHPATPILGQGAGMAVEDAVVLAKELALARDLRDQAAVESALRAYERNRIPRTAAIVRESRRVGRNIMWEDPVRSWIREAFLRLTPGTAWRKRGEADAAYEA